MDALAEISGLTWVLIFGLAFPLVFLLLPRKQLVPLSASMPALIAFFFIFMIAFMLVSIPLFLLSSLIGSDSDTLDLVTLLLSVLFAAGLSYLFVRRYVFASVRENVKQAEGEDALLEKAADSPSPPITSRILVVLPFGIVFAGAVLTRMNGHLLYTYTGTIILAIAAAAVLSCTLLRESTDTSDMGGLAKVLTQVSLAIPFTLTYAIFLFILCNTDPEVIKGLL